MNNWIKSHGSIYWYDQYTNNEQALAFSQYDPDRIVSEIVGTGADIVAIYAANQNGITYYPSDLWPQHPNLKGRDYVGDLVSRFRDAGKKVILYINWLDSKHPEWRVQVPGQAVPDEPKLVSWADPSKANWKVRNLPTGGWIVNCLNSPHRQEILAITREICEKYQPDGFSLDMFQFPDICVCDYCKPALREICGDAEITKELIEQNWNKYIDWRTDRCSSLISEISKLVHEFGITTIHNSFAPIYLQAFTGLSQEWFSSLDVSLSECFDTFLVDCSDLNTTSITVRLQHALKKPAWILQTSTPLHYMHKTISKAQWELYAAASKANGCHIFGPCGCGARPDTTTDTCLLENAKHGLDFFMDDADLTEKAEPFSKIALVFSWQTRKYCPPIDKGIRWAQDFVGWSRLLIEEHLPFDIIIAEDTKNVGSLSNYELVILPEATYLSDDFCDIISEYVRKGGSLLGTGATSRFDELGEKRADLALNNLFGISSKGSVEGHFGISCDGDAEPASGNFELVTYNGQALNFRMDTDPACSVAIVKDPMPIHKTSWPVACEHHYGQGKSLYIAFDIGRYFEMHGDEHIAAMMRNYILSLVQTRQIEVKAPRTLETTLWQQYGKNRLIIHLANRTVPWSLPTAQRQITEIVPLHNIEISIESPSDEVIISSRHCEVSYARQESKLLIVVKRVDAYAAVIIENK